MRTLRTSKLQARLAVVGVLAMAAACGSSDSGNTSDGEGGADATADVHAGNEGGGGTDSSIASEGGQGAEGGEAGQGQEGGGAEASTEAGHDGAPTDGASDARHEGGDAGFVMAAHPPLPVVQFNNYGGPKGSGVLTAAKVVTVTFAGDPYQIPLEALGNTYASSTVWDVTRPGLCDPGNKTCVGGGPTGVAVHLGAQPAPDAGKFNVETWLAEQLQSGVLPAPDAANPTNTIYTVVFQRGFKMPGLCTSFFGYHSAIHYNKQWVTYAVVGECAPFSGMSTLDLAAQTVNHEISEAASDPFNGYDLDYGDINNQGWIGALGGGEVGDLCDWYGPSPYYRYWPGENVAYKAGSTTLNIQRIWNPEAAAAGGDPCLPIPNDVVFFEVAPTQQVYVLDVGTSLTFDAYAYSTARTPDWTLISAADPSVLDVKIEGATAVDGGAPTLKVNNGDRPKVTITLLKDPGKFDDAGTLTRGTPAEAVLHSYAGPPDAPTAAYEWGFIVLTPEDATKDHVDAGLSKRSRDDVLEAAGLPPGARGVRWVHDPTTTTPRAR